MALVVGVATILADPGASAAPAAPAAQPTPPPCPTAAGTVAAATAAASTCHGRVEVADARTERGQLFVNHDGSFTSVQAARVQRVRRADGSWTAPDPTLHRTADGRYVPAAAALEMAFSAGGSAALVTVRRGGAELALRWPGRLPEPSVAGSQLTYPEVLPGVDLVVTATVEGFGEVLVVKSASAAADAALAEVRLETATRGMRLRGESSGTLAGVADSGEILFGSGTPVMWDSSASATDPNRGATPTAMPTEVSATAVTIRPDQAMLTAASTRYPVTIDPAISWTGWTMINSRFTSQSYWSYDRKDCPEPYQGVDCAKVGYTDQATTMTYRSMFEFATSDYLGKHVLDAKLSMDLLYSWVCSDSATEVHLVSAALGPDTKWSNTASAWGGSAASTSNSSCNRSRRRTEWGVTGIAQSAAAGWWSRTTLGLQAANESNHNGWKKFDAGTAKLTVTYNSYPNAPDGLTVEGAACAQGDGRPYVRTTGPTLRARLTDPDGSASQLKGTFTWWPLANPSGTASASQGAVASGATAQVAVADGGVADGQAYAFKAVADDGTDSGQESAACEFTVDTTPPADPGPVTSSDYPADDQYHGGVGVAGTFTFTPPASGAAEVTGYAYSFDTGIQPSAAPSVAADATTHTATVPITPPTDGPNVLSVWSRDIAGNFSAHATTYRFSVRSGTGPDALWRFDENSGTTAGDDTDHGNQLTLSGPTWTPGRGRSGAALLMAGAGEAATAGPVTTRDPVTAAPTTVRTDANLTVSAWVRLDAAGSVTQTAVSQDGVRVSAFMLGYSGADNRWQFAMNSADGYLPTGSQVLSTAAPSVGVWTHLTGTFDAAGRTIRLSVNGAAPTQAAAAAGGFNASGGVAIGRAWRGGAPADAFTGAVDDVRIYARALSATEDQFKEPLVPVTPKAVLSGDSVQTGGSLELTMDAAGDTAAVSMRYSFGSTPEVTVALPGPGGSVTVPITPLTAGPQLVRVVALNAAGKGGGDVYLPITVRLAPALHGTVTDDTSGAVVSGAIVRLMPSGTEVTTAADGTYTFGGIAAGTQTVSARVPDRPCGLYASTQVEVLGVTYQDLRLKPQSDAFGYTCAVSTRPFVPAEGTVLPLSGDDETTQVNLPFPVWFYGKSYATAAVSTNGVVSFAGSTAQYTPTSLPDGAAPNGLVAPFWDDLVVDDSASVRTMLVSRPAYNRQFVIEWRNIRFFGGTDSVRLSFEAVFFENGDIQFNYTGLDSAHEQGEHAGVGIESPGGTLGLEYAYQQPTLRNGQAITLRYPADGHPIPQRTLTGTVTDGGVPVAGADVRLMPQSETARTDANGRFTFAGLEPAGYTLMSMNGCKVANAVVDLTSDRVVDLGLAPHPDGFGYQCTTAPKAFVPANDSVLAWADTDEQTVTLPFPFAMYGHLYTTADISVDGSVGLPDADGGFAYVDALWDDLTVDSSATVRTAVVGAAPNRQFVVEWRDVYFTADGPAHRVTFEAILGEDGTITCDYADVEASDRAQTAWVGIEYWTAESDGDATFELWYQAGSPLGQQPLRNNQAIVFQPPS